MLYTGLDLHRSFSYITTMNDGQLQTIEQVRHFNRLKELTDMMKRDRIYSFR